MLFYKANNSYDELLSNDCKHTHLTTVLLLIFCLLLQSELRVHVKSLRRVRQFLQQAGYVVEEKIPGSGDTTESSNWRPPKKKKKQAESAGGNPICTVKIRLLKPFVLKTDCIQQPDDTSEDEEDNNDDDNDDEDDDNRDDGEDAVWSDGNFCESDYSIVEHSHVCLVMLHNYTHGLLDHSVTTKMYYNWSFIAAPLVTGACYVTLRIRSCLLK